MAKRSASEPVAAFNRPGPHLVIPNFFESDDAKRLLDFAKDNQEAFEPSRLNDAEHGSRVDRSFRVSHRLRPVTALEPLIGGRLREVFGEVTQALGCDQFEIAGLEFEMVAHSDGAFFSRHIDTVTGDENFDGQIRSARAISMVYYFSTVPPKFSGGALRLHSLAGSGEPGTFVDVLPEHNTALFFLSWFPHEVLPVACESGSFMDSRFAINCWVYK